MRLEPRTLRRAADHLRERDPVLREIVDRVGPCLLRVDRGTGHFGALAESILYQQLHANAAAAIHARFLDLFDRRRPRPRTLLATSDAVLRQAGLSRQKVGYLRDLASQVENGLPLPRIGRLEDEQVIDVLTAVKGIGRWTAEMFLMFRLGRLDVLPVDDYGVRKAMQVGWRKRALPNAAWMRQTAEPWRPYRTVASWYLWRSLDVGG